MGRALRHVLAGIVPALLAFPASAQEAPVGPCSPYRAADGDVPSEMPGCARRSRSLPGSLADEMQFRRARNSADVGDTLDEDGPPRDGARRRRPR